jgi:hypothetical protein
MPLLKNPRHERFCQLVAGGMPGTRAYRKVAGARAGKPENDDVHSHEWSRRPDVKARIQKLMAENAQRAQMTREELMAFYAAVIRTPANQVPAGSPVIQAYEQDGEGRVKLRLCDKVQAGAALARMCGYNEPEQLRLSSGNSLTNYLLELRSQSLFGGPVLSLEQPALPVRNEENGEEHRSANG